MTIMDDIGTDILLERPYLFEVGGERFAIYPPSLGLLSLMQIRLSKIGINPVALQSVGAIELLRVAKNKKKECCELIAIASCRTHEDALNDRETRRRAELFAECLDYDDVATLIVGVLQFNRHKQWMDEAGIIKERNRMAKVMRYKQGGGNIAFGGKSVFGQLIDPAMERYGWTYEYVVWGVSAAVLEILMADKVCDIFLTDEEKKKIPAHLIDTGDVINGDDPRNWEKMKKIMDLT